MALLTLVLAAALALGPGDPPLAIVNARVVDGTGAPPVQATVLVRGERIAAVGTFDVPPGATVLDATGLTLLPGLFDTHGHCFTVDGKDQYEAYPLLFLAGGVTTVFSPGEHDPAGAYALRDRLQRGQQDGCRLLTAGGYLERGQSEFTWLPAYADLPQALQWLERDAAQRNGVKLMTRVTAADAAALVAAAHARGLSVTGHLGELTARRAAELGIDRLEHGLFAMSEFAPWDGKGLDAWVAKFRRLGELDLDSAPVQELIDTLVAHRVALSATTVSFAAWAPDFAPVCPDWERYLAPPARRLEVARRRRIEQLPAEQGRWFAAGVQKQLGFLRRVHERGGVVVTGTDPGDKFLIPGHALHRELELLVQAGFAPLQAIRAATQLAARTLRVEAELGTIDAGKVADLVLVHGDPTQDIGAIADTVAVWKAGRRFDPAALRERAVGRIR